MASLRRVPDFAYVDPSSVPWILSPHPYSLTLQWASCGNAWSWLLGGLTHIYISILLHLFYPSLHPPSSIHLPHNSQSHIMAQNFMFSPLWLLLIAFFLSSSVASSQFGIRATEFELPPPSNDDLIPLVRVHTQYLTKRDAHGSELVKPRNEIQFDYQVGMFSPPPSPFIKLSHPLASILSIKIVIKNI